jgi:hypothetical protein
MNLYSITTLPIEILNIIESYTGFKEYYKNLYSNTVIIDIDPTKYKQKIKEYYIDEVLDFIIMPMLIDCDTDDEYDTDDDYFDYRQLLHRR